jgi:hypothetical protein
VKRETGEKGADVQLLIPSVSPFPPVPPVSRNILFTLHGGFRLISQPIQNRFEL